MKAAEEATTAGGSVPADGKATAGRDCNAAAFQPKSVSVQPLPVTTAQTTNIAFAIARIRTGARDVAATGMIHGRLSRYRRESATASIALPIERAASTLKS